MGYPSIFPTGTLIYNKEKTYSGYTVFPSSKGALLIDMNGREVQLWAGLGRLGGISKQDSAGRICSRHNRYKRRKIFLSGSA
jgi:hypothetical protein